MHVPEKYHALELRNTNWSTGFWEFKSLTTVRKDTSSSALSRRRFENRF
jgi:hypothetical protein